MIALMVGEGAIDGDVVGDDGDRGRGTLNWGTCKYLALWGHALYFCQNIHKFANIYIFQHWISPCLDTVSDYLQYLSKNSTSATLI